LSLYVRTVSAVTMLGKCPFHSPTAAEKPPGYDTLDFDENTLAAKAKELEQAYHGSFTGEFGGSMVCSSLLSCCVQQGFLYQQ